MKGAMEYRGYTGSVEFSPIDALFYGRVQGVKALVSYEGADASELQSDFHDAVDNYIILAHCSDTEETGVSSRGDLVAV